MYLALLYNMWDLSSPCSGSMESTTASPGKSHPASPFSALFHWLLFVSLPNRKIGFFLILFLTHLPLCATHTLLCGLPAHSFSNSLYTSKSQICIFRFFS